MVEGNTSVTIRRRLPRPRILQDYGLVWVDGNFDASDSDCQNTLQQLQAVANSVQSFTESNACVDFLRNIGEEKVLVIASACVAEELVPKIHSMPQVDTIFIFCSDPEWHKPCTEGWDKIKDVYAEIESICKALQQRVKQCNRNSTPMSFVPSGASGSDVNLDQLEPSFMYTQLFKEALLQMEYDENARNDLVAYYREQTKNPVQLKMIDEFERDYRSDKAIWWYTQHSYTYEVLNHALRLLEADILVDMGFLIHDLHQQIEQLHREQVTQTNGPVMTFYRGQGLSATDFEKLKKSKGGLLSFNNFLSTSNDRDVALLLAESSSAVPDKVGILFVMIIDPSVTSTPFADIADHSYFEEEAEVLFSMHSVFRVDQVEDLTGIERLFEVRLTMTADDDPQLSLLRERMDEEIQGSTEWQRIGHLLIMVGQTDKAEALYNRLLTQGEADSAHHNHMLGCIKDTQGDYKGALSYYKKSYDIHRRTLPEDHPSLAHCYNNIGRIYDNMGEHSKALTFYEKCLGIQKKSLPDNHPDLAKYYTNIGSVYQDMREYANALLYYEKCLDIQTKSLPPNHPLWATSYNNIGSMYHNMGEHAKALSYYEECLDIRLKSLPVNHSDFASSYNNIGAVYHRIGEYSKALPFFEKSLEIQKKSLRLNHPILATSYNNIGSLYQDMGENLKALEYHQQCLDIREKSIPADHPDVARFYNNIASVYRNMGEYPKALAYHENGLEIQKKTLPLNHPLLATSCSNIGSVYYNMGEHAKALSCYEECLDIRLKSLPVNQTDVARSYNNIGGIYQSMGEYSKALPYHEKCLDMRQKSLPVNHSDLATSFSNLGWIYYCIGEYPVALSYYEKCLDIQQQSLPADHPDLAGLYNNIGSAYCQIKEYVKSLTYLELALHINQHVLPLDHPHIKITLHSIAIVKENS